MQLHIYDNAEKLTVAVADWMVDYINSTLLQRDKFTIALSGGNTPKQLFAKLASAAYRDRIDWKRMCIFWGDERAVPFDDERNNAKVAFDVLLDKVPVPASQVHRMGIISPRDSAIEYQQLLQEYFNDTHTSFDLVLLGLGEDGHTLSIFPDSPVLNDHQSWVKAVYVPAQNMWRITLTPVIVNKAAKIIFLVTGASKAKVLKQILEGNKTYPASLIQPTRGELHWFLDREAMPGELPTS